jgi:hypothetical protein
MEKRWAVESTASIAHWQSYLVYKGRSAFKVNNEVFEAISHLREAPLKSRRAASFTKRHGMCTLLYIVGKPKTYSSSL